MVRLFALLTVVGEIEFFGVSSGGELLCADQFWLFESVVEGLLFSLTGGGIARGSSIRLEPAHDGIMLVVLVSLGEVEGVVNSAGFLAANGAVDDEGGDRDEVAKFEDIGVHAIAPVEFAHFAVEIAKAEACATETFVGAYDGDVVPHCTAELVPIVVDVDQLVGGSSVAVFPIGDGEGRRIFTRREAAQDIGEGAPGHDVAFE